MTLWERRDYLVLRALAALDDDSVRYDHLVLDGKKTSGTLGLDLAAGDVYDALLTLREADYVHFDAQRSGGLGVMLTHLQVTGAGYQALGEWPFFTEVTPATLAAMLERFAEEAPTDEEAENARRAARYVGALSGDALKAAVKTVVVEAVKAAVRIGSI